MRVSRAIILAGLLLLPVQAMAQSGGAGGGATGTGTASPGALNGSLGNPNPSSQTSPNNLNAAGNPTLPNPPGTNSAGTAQSSGSGVTTGSAAGTTAEDKKIQNENRQVDQKLKGICKGC